MNMDSNQASSGPGVPACRLVLRTRTARRRGPWGPQHALACIALGLAAGVARGQVAPPPSTVSSPASSATPITRAAEAPGKAVYRWTDVQGRTHYGDQVPDRYRAKAVKVDAPVNVAPGPSSDARAREPKPAAPLDRSRAGTPVPAAGDSTGAPRAIGIGPDSASERPSQATDCASRRARYLDSLACFAPYRTALGGIKPEAFEHCVEVADPSAECGPVITSP